MIHTVTIPKDLVPLALLGIACIPVIIFSLAYWFLKRRKMQNLRERLVGLDMVIEDFEERLLTIETHAIDYMNSLSQEANRGLYEIKELLTAGKNLANEIQELIESRDNTALAEAEKLLLDDFPLNEEMIRNFDGTQVRRFPKYRNWKDVVENHLQQVGREISRASRKASASGLPKRQKRQSTVLGLMQAGVRAAANTFRMQNAPVRTLLRKNNSLKA